MVPVSHLDVFLGDGHETAVGARHALHEHLRRSPLQALDERLVRLEEGLLGPLQSFLFPHKPGQYLVQDLGRAGKGHTGCVAAART